MYGSLLLPSLKKRKKEMKAENAPFFSLPNRTTLTEKKKL